MEGLVYGTGPGPNQSAELRGAVLKGIMDGPQVVFRKVQMAPSSRLKQIEMTFWIGGFPCRTCESLSKLASFSKYLSTQAL
jgi:hypothetical protein